MARKLCAPGGKFAHLQTETIMSYWSRAKRRMQQGDGDADRDADADGSGNGNGDEENYEPEE